MAVVKFLETSLDDSAMLGTVVMPQLESCGWETCFSLQHYGTDLSKLKAPCVPRLNCKAAMLLETSKLGSCWWGANGWKV